MPRGTQHGSTDTYGRLMPQFMLGKAPPVVSRRWSSVEIGTHRASLNRPARNRPPLSRASTGTASPAPPSQESTLTQKNLKTQNQGSKLPCTTAEQDIVRTVRERLTIRKVASDHQSEAHVEPPLSITLRRASGASAASGNNASENDYGGISGATTPLAGLQGILADYPTAYLITSEEIDSITELIAANLKRKYNSHTRSRNSSASSRKTRSLSNSTKGFVPSNLSAAESSVPGIEAPRSSTWSRNQPDYLEVMPAGSGSQSLSRVDSKKSVHEVIWKGGGGASRGSVTSAASNEDSRLMAIGDTSSEPSTSPDILPEKRKKAVTYKGDAFDPNNARASISEWSWRLPQNDIPMIVTSSESDSTDVTPKTTKTNPPPFKSAASHPKERVTPRVRPIPRYAASHEELQDVVSFPPLSTRKTTSEWFSPLPEIVSASPLAKSPLATSRSLYDLGVDVNVGPLGSATPTAPFTSWVRSAEVSRAPSPSIEFRADYGFGPSDTDPPMNDGGRRKSVLKPHPKASSRIGESSRMGSSIGNYSGARRRSSVPRIQRVRTIDNIHKGERETAPSRWRPPSVCPPRLSISQIFASPADYEEAYKEEPAEDRVPEILTRLQRSRSGITDRISLIEAKSPQLPKPDRAGIYGAITGTLRRSIGAACATDNFKHNCDDCATEPRSPSVDWIG
ncbi:hypothetical protein LZ554_005285 [Drepanopeziza brunnea f. sp. 'monogermtubi']|nr:hypothetical protein LZ554_005285 [Drepanopeziza brunnea f. sp. 'monogermtubi']